MSDANALRARIADELRLRPANLVDWRGADITVAYGINREINSAIRHYETQRFRWNEQRESEFATTVQATRTYSLPANFVSMDSLKVKYNGSFIPVQFVTWQEIDMADRDVTGSEGVPTRYTNYGNVLRLFPVPHGAYTLVASYIFRSRPMSLTGSYCAIVTMGRGSLTATSTASHNNPMNGWTTDGEELIRARASASFKINYLEDVGREQTMFAARGEEFLSVREKQAYTRLADETADYMSTGRFKPYSI